MQDILKVKAPDFLSGGGEMGERIRNFDWSKTSLGDPKHWENSLKTCVRIMLSSTQPIWIGWGKELIKLYNDAYIDIVRGKHPLALGQPASIVWKDIWKDIEPMLAKAMIKDEGVYTESQLLIMERSGYPEEVYYTFSYTPVLGDDGKPAGIICYNVADTNRIINERSLKTLQQLDSLAQKKTELEVYEQASKALETNNRDFPVAVISKIEPEENIAVPVAWAGINKDHPGLPKIIDLQNPEERFKNFVLAVIENRIVETGNNGSWENMPKGAWDIEPQQFIHVPINTANRKLPLAILSIALNPYRKFDDVFRNFVQLIADRISLGVNNVLAYEEERKRAAALEQLDKAKTIFFSNISHEFRTPLTLMLGTIEEALHDPETIPNNKKRISVAHRNAMRLLKLVNTLLDFSRIESGRQKAHYVLTDIISFTKSLAGNFRSVIEKAGLEFIVQTGTITQPVFVDKQMWEKIVFNLLSNAFKYTLNGSITVSLYAANDRLVLDVTDTGVGIPEKELPHMFERFHRVENATGRTYEGTGIGLSLVKELVQLHGGDISVKSKQGKGSTFTVIIPFGKEHLPAIQTSGKTEALEDILSDVYVDEANSLLDNPELKLEPKNNNEQLSTILIVDDNADMRQHIQSVLQKQFNVITAANGMDALDIIIKEKPSLVLSDIMMPVMDGIQLLKEIKNNKETEQIPVILLTARAGEESKIEGFETGADDYLVKPFSANELLSRIKAQVEIQKRRDEVELRLRSFLMQAPAAIAILEGKDYLFTLVNPLFEQIFAPGRKITGLTVREAYPEVEGQGVYEMFNNVFVTGKPFSQHAFPAALNINGEIKTRYYDFILQPIKDIQDATTGIMAHVVDITDSVLSNKRIEESEAKVRRIFEQAPVAIAIYKGSEFIVDFANEHMLEFYGKKKEEIIGKKIFEVFPEVAQHGVKALHEEVLRSGKPFSAHAQKHEYYKNGKAYIGYFDIGFEPVREDDGSVSGLIITGHEVTEQVLARQKMEESKQALEQLSAALEQKVKDRTKELEKKNIELNKVIEELVEREQKDEKKDDFILMASHELKTPVTTIKGYIQLMIDLLDPANAQKRTPDLGFFHNALKTMDKQVMNLTMLISDMLDLSKIEKGQLELRKTDFNYPEFLRETVQNAQFTTHHKLNLEIAYDCMVNADKGRIEQVLLNLITNAVKYSPEATSIEIKLFRYDENYAAISVSDHGIGMENVDLEKIFDRFYRVEGRKEKTFPGFGIGLFIAKDIVTKHQGKIFVTSKKNEGSEFIFLLPCIEY